MKSALYVGRVRHERRGKLSHAFSYGLHVYWLDLAELDGPLKEHRFFSVERPNLLSFRRKDYLGPTELSLDEAVRALVAARSGHRPRGPIRLLTQVRVLGLVFNPVSFYYCYDEADTAVEFIVADITNTPWGERHAYVLDRREQAGHTSRHVFNKDFHVSPFINMDVECDWRFGEPGEQLGVRMVNRQAGEKTFEATLGLERRPLDAPNLRRSLLKRPFMTAEILWGIYWQAFKLLLKGAPFHDHPQRASHPLTPETRT